MKKIIVWLATLVLVLVSVQAASLPLCTGEKVNLNQNCTILTPSITCSIYDYDILNSSGNVIVQDAPLTFVNGSVYSLNFTLTQFPEQYLVRLCEGTTREVKVERSDEGKMAEIAIAILVMGLIAYMYYASVTIPDKYWQLKMMFFYGSLALGWIAANIALRVAIDNSSSASLQSSLENFYFAFNMVGSVAVIFIAIILFKYGFGKFKDIALAVTGKKPVEEDNAW